MKITKNLVLLQLVITSIMLADTYYTWPGIEVDKCASVWLIKKFVDEDAEIKVVPKGDSVKDATPFDIPHAEFSRKHGKTTFDTILEKHGLKDPALLRIANIVKDAEINVWAKKRMEETIGIQKIIYGLDELYKDDCKCLQESVIIFDALHKMYSKQTEK